MHLDTSFVIRGLIPESSEDLALRRWIMDGTPLGMSAVGWVELLCGPLGKGHLDLLERVIGQIAPLDAETASLAAQLYNSTGRRRGTLADCMIAATAMRADAALATSNREDFTRFVAQGLRLAETGS